MQTLMVYSHKAINDTYIIFIEHMFQTLSSEFYLCYFIFFPFTVRNWVIRSDQISHSVVSNSLWPHESQHAMPPCPSPTPRVHPDSYPSSQWCHPAISSSVVPFSSCPQLLEKCKSKLQWDITSHRSEWPSSKSLHTINAGEGVEKREPSCTVGRNVNW